MVAPDEPKFKTCDELLDILAVLLDPQPSEWALQHSFLSTLQEDAENVTDFGTKLKMISAHCNFKCPCSKSVAEIFLRAQFIRGLKDSDIRASLLQNSQKLNFSQVLEHARILETSKKESLQINPTPSEIFRVFQQPATRKSGTGNTGIPQLKGKCYRCGDSKHRAAACKHATTTCSACHKVGHLSKVCLSTARSSLSREQHQIENIVGPDEEELYEIQNLDTRATDKYIIQIYLNNKPFAMEIDTGAALSSISYQDFKKLFPNTPIFSTNIRLRTYTGEIIHPKGKFYVQVSHNDSNFTGPLYVIDLPVQPILGREWIRKMKVNVFDINSVFASSVDRVLSKFKDVFADHVGEIPDYRGKLTELKENSKPIFIKHRKVPYALKFKVENELDRLENLGVIRKIENSEWGTPIVPVLKPSGAVRICADYKSTLNKCIKDMNYPIPTIDDIFAQLKGGKYFCTLDLRLAYLHMRMDEDSAKLQTISTHKGCYEVLRLMFGTKVAPGLWQQYMDNLLQGLDGVVCFFDDILIKASSHQEMLHRLRQVLDKLRSANLTLNKDKCTFFQSSVQYLGHVIDEKGLHTARDKVEALIKAEPPKDTHQVKSFLGMANYYNKFIPNMATILHPINRLISKQIKFHWTSECQAAFDAIKSALAGSTVLTHFQDHLPLLLATDASPGGLGAVLSHRFPDGKERPIAYASRSLTKAERNYSQIDKEATAIFWGLKKFFQYIYGRKFTLITDHKPLVSIFNPDSQLPSITTTRLFRYAQFLSGFDYTIEYKSTIEHGNADFFSRFPLQSAMPEDHLSECDTFHIRQIATLPVTKSAIQAATRQDTELRPLVQVLEKGESLKPYGWEEHELTLQDNCVFRGDRVFIPRTFRRPVLDELHAGHLGMTKMKALARSYCYWKGIDKDIENIVNKCKPCCLKRNNPAKVGSHPWELPSGPWQRLHIDFAGPLQGRSFLIVVDAYSKWLEVVPTTTTTATWVIKTLGHLFSTFGLPFTIVSDNGTQFKKSEQFQTFLKSNGIHHKTTAPYHPATNGQAERYVQTVKRGLEAMAGEGGDIHTKLTKLVTQLRKAPNATGNSAYTKMFSYPVRTILDLMVQDKELETPKEKHSIKEQLRDFKPGSSVLVRAYSGKSKWVLGTIIKKIGDLHYNVKVQGQDNLIKRHIDQLRKTEIREED